MLVITPKKLLKQWEPETGWDVADCQQTAPALLSLAKVKAAKWLTEETTTQWLFFCNLWLIAWRVLLLHLRWVKTTRSGKQMAHSIVINLPIILVSFFSSFFSLPHSFVDVVLVPPRLYVMARYFTLLFKETWSGYCDCSFNLWVFCGLSIV